MKIYPKTYEDLHSSQISGVRDRCVGSALGTPEELASKFQDLYKETIPTVFRLVVCHVWLEQQFTYRGKRRKRRFANGWDMEAGFGHFMKFFVRDSQKPFVGSFTFTAVATYLKDFFPNFLYKDPFKEPDSFKYPYKNIGLGHLCFVYLHHERMEMLKYAEEKEMNYLEFVNWATNQTLMYNEEKGKEIYVISQLKYMWSYIKPKKRNIKRNNAFYVFKHPTFREKKW